MDLSKNLYKNKTELLLYLRGKASGFLKIIPQNITDKREKANLVNKEVILMKDTLLTGIIDLAKKEKWATNDILNNVLMIAYCSDIVMIESRNNVWAYEYMAFSRRIGELWESFCRLCWEYNPSSQMIEPPTFTKIKASLEQEIRVYIEKLRISKEEKTQLLTYYTKTWNLLASGEINMSSDLHFKIDETKYIVDLKSGFSSNEKGNTNRLLLVASIYKSLNDKYECVIFVRSKEDEANHYLQTLKNSGLWKVYCENEAYEKMKEYTEFDIKKWIKENIDWEKDFNTETMKFFKGNELDIYLKW